MAGIAAQIAMAIGKVESGGNPNAINFRQNNRGNLRSWGSTPIEHGFAHFKTMEEGDKALTNQILKNIGRGLTLNEFFGGKDGVYGGYAPSGDKNNPAAYAARVAKELGIDANVPLNQIPSAAGGMVVPSGFNAILGSLQPREWVLPANIAAGAFSNRDAVREYHSRTPQVVSHVSYRTVSLGGVNLGGIHITQPGADIRTIRGEMVQLIREELHEQIMQDILQMQPIW